MLLAEHEVSASWHPSKNKLSLEELTTQSGRRVWWVCSKGHEWECRIADRIQAKNKAGTDCPYCAGRKVWVGYNDFASLHPVIASEWHPTKNSDFTPSDFTAGSHMKAWWICKNDHEWQTSIKHRTGRLKTGCVYCAGNLVSTGFNDLLTINPTLSAEWHPTKNDGLYPNKVLPNSHRKVWWLGRCDHEWFAAISSRNRNSNAGCPVCSGKEVLKGFNDLASQHPILAATWHPAKNSDLFPYTEHMSSQKQVWWQCSLGHDWKTSIASRARTANGVTTYNFCPICSGRKVWSGFNDLASRHPALASEWHPTKNGTKEPHEVYAGGKKRWWWQCVKGHEWETGMESRTKPNGSNCSICYNNDYTSKAEKDILDFLTEAGYSVEQSNRSIFKNKRELDLYISAHNVAIEFNGLYYHSEEMGKDEQYHKNKWLMCSEKSIDLIQVWEDSWMENPIKVKSLLLKSLQTPVDLDLSGWAVIPCSQDEASEFIAVNTFRDNSVEDMNFKLVDSTNSTRAVVAFSVTEDATWTVRCYADNLEYITSQLLIALLTEVKKRFGVTAYRAMSDNCTLDHKVLAGAGFRVSGDIPPSPHVMKKVMRVPVQIGQESYTYKDAAGASHEVKKKKLIWDAGKTLWIK